MPIKNLTPEKLLNTLLIDILMIFWINEKKYKDDNAFIAQIVAEIDSNPKQLLKQEPNIIIQGKPRPRAFWYTYDDTKKQDKIL